MDSAARQVVRHRGLVKATCPPDASYFDQWPARTEVLISTTALTSSAEIPNVVGIF